MLVVVAEVGVSVPGQETLDAGTYVPCTDDGVHGDGTSVDERPQGRGIMPFRRASAVRKDVYDHVRSMAEVGIPESRVNCSARRYRQGVYFC